MELDFGMDYFLSDALPTTPEHQEGDLPHLNPLELNVDFRLGVMVWSQIERKKMADVFPDMHNAEISRRFG